MVATSGSRPRPVEPRPQAPWTASVPARSAAGMCHGVRICGPSAVIATVNSKCAAGEPSWRVDRPAVAADAHRRAAGGGHRLDRQHHPLLQQRPLARLAVVGDLRVLVHAAPDAVADERAHDREPGALGDLLDRVREVAHAVARRAPARRRRAATPRSPRAGCGEARRSPRPGTCGRRRRPSRRASRRRRSRRSRRPSGARARGCRARSSSPARRRSSRGSRGSP